MSSDAEQRIVEAMSDGLIIAMREAHKPTGEGLLHSAVAAGLCALYRELAALIEKSGDVIRLVPNAAARERSVDAYFYNKTIRNVDAWESFRAGWDAAIAACRDAGRG